MWSNHQTDSSLEGKEGVMVRPDMAKWGQTFAGCRPTAKDRLVTNTITGLEKEDTAPAPRQVAGLTADVPGSDPGYPSQAT